MSPTEAVVAGAGPTGLTLALELARRGVEVRILDKSPEPFAGSRGKGLTARSQEVMDDLGIVDEVVEAGFRHLPNRVAVRGRVVGDSDPHADLNPTPDRPYESGLMIPQWRTEQILRERLSEFGIDVERGVEVVGFEQTTDKVTVRLAGGGTVMARYLVGCDGGRSTVRKALGVSFEGTGGIEGMLLGDVSVDGLTPDRWYQWSHPEKASSRCARSVGSTPGSSRECRSRTSTRRGTCPNRRWSTSSECSTTSPAIPACDCPHRRGCPPGM